MAPPYRTAEFDILFGSGVSKLGCLFDAAEAAGVVERKGSWYAYGGENLAQGRDNAVEVLRERGDLRQEVERRTREALGLDRAGGDEAAGAEGAAGADEAAGVEQG